MTRLLIALALLVLSSSFAFARQPDTCGTDGPPASLSSMGHDHDQGATETDAVADVMLTIAQHDGKIEDFSAISPHKTMWTTADQITCDCTANGQLLTRGHGSSYANQMASHYDYTCYEAQGLDNRNVIAASGSSASSIGHNFNPEFAAENRTSFYMLN